MEELLKLSEEERKKDVKLKLGLEMYTFKPAADDSNKLEINYIISKEENKLNAMDFPMFSSVVRVDDDKFILTGGALHD